LIADFMRTQVILKLFLPSSKSIEEANPEGAADASMMNRQRRFTFWLIGPPCTALRVNG
jgi:hypothetical protein